MPRVFVSYSHDSLEHASAVHALCEHLRSHAVDVVFDGYTAPPAEGWYEWSEKQIDDADTVLVICTPTYRRRFEGKEEPVKGLGASWEARKLRRLLVQERGLSAKLVLVLLPGHSVECIPEILWEHHRVEYRDGSGPDELLMSILGLPRTMRRADADWASALAGLVPSILGFERLAMWVRWNLGGPDVEGAESPIAYVRRVIEHARVSETIEHLLDRLAEIDASRTEEIERVRALWHVSASRATGSVAQSSDRSADSVAQAPDRATGSATQGNRASRSNGRAAEPTHTAIVLDRTTAWRSLIKEGADAEGNLAFIVYGTHQQDLHLFLRRIQVYFTQREGCSRPHRVLAVERDWDHTQAVTAQEWTYAAIRATHARKGSLAEALAFDAWTQPVLMLMTAGQGPLRRLTDDARRGLLGFLTEQLPAALAEAVPRHPVRVLLPLEVVDPGNPPVVREIQRAMRAQRAILALQEPMRLTIPSWPEIEHYIIESFPELNDDAVQRCEAEYEAIVRTDPSRIHLQDLADPLHHRLVDLVSAARRGQLATVS